MARLPLVFLGSEAIAQGTLTRGQLRWNYLKIHPDVYLPKNSSRTLWDDIYAAWLWSGRRGVIAGRAAAALHGAKWVDDFTRWSSWGRSITHRRSSSFDGNGSAMRTS
jgi:hypothetical protein